MMLRIALYSITAVLLGAHFFRAGNLIMVALCLLTPMLFLLKLRWSLYLLQLSAYGAAAIWVNAAIAIIQLRLQFGQPWQAAAAILAHLSQLTG